MLETSASQYTRKVVSIISCFPKASILTLLESRPVQCAFERCPVEFLLNHLRAAAVYEKKTIPSSSFPSRRARVRRMALTARLAAPASATSDARTRLAATHAGRATAVLKSANRFEFPPRAPPRRRRFFFGSWRGTGRRTQRDGSTGGGRWFLTMKGKRFLTGATGTRASAQND